MKQVQGFLGHHAASFTIDTSIHLLDDDLPELTFMDQLAAVHPRAPRAMIETAGSPGNDRPPRPEEA